MFYYGVIFFVEIRVCFIRIFIFIEKFYIVVGIVVNKFVLGSLVSFLFVIFLIEIGISFIIRFSKM